MLQELPDQLRKNGVLLLLLMAQTEQYLLRTFTSLVAVPNITPMPEFAL